jgi:nucleotide-binding universal stress UspA family protein
MKIVLGVDEKRAETPSLAAELVRRLRFPCPSIDVVHVLTPMVYDDWGVQAALSPEAFESSNRETRNLAWGMVNHTTTMLRDVAPSLFEEADPALVHGVVRDSISVSEGLLAQADQEHTDMIAVDGPHLGPLGAFLTSSVARSLVIGSHDRSLLLAKKSAENPGLGQMPTPKGGAFADGGGATLPSTDQPLRAVFATDHSAYANDCLTKWLHLAPRGISHLTVMTAYPQKELIDEEVYLDDLAIRPVTVVRESLTALNAGVLKRLAPYLEANGITSESLVVGEPVNEAITHTMEHTNAELLILGARGHGFVDRLSPGSVSFHQAMTAPYSLLILRA